MKTHLLGSIFDFDLYCNFPLCFWFTNQIQYKVKIHPIIKLLFIALTMEYLKPPACLIQIPFNLPYNAFKHFEQSTL